MKCLLMTISSINLTIISNCSLSLMNSPSLAYITPSYQIKKKEIKKLFRYASVYKIRIQNTVLSYWVANRRWTRLCHRWIFGLTYTFKFLKRYLRLNYRQVVIEILPSNMSTNEDHKRRSNNSTTMKTTDNNKILYLMFYMHVLILFI